jgi:hypothetical protein
VWLSILPTASPLTIPTSQYASPELRAADEGHACEPAEKSVNVQTGAPALLVWVDAHTVWALADIYSLGVILYEITAQFPTFMERAQSLLVLEEKCEIATWFKKRYPWSASIVSRMTHKKWLARIRMVALVHAVHCRLEELNSNEEDTFERDQRRLNACGGTVQAPASRTWAAFKRRNAHTYSFNLHNEDNVALQKCMS